LPRRNRQRRVCVDVDQRKIDILNGGGVPIHEPGLKELIDRNRASGRLQFSTDIEASVAHGDIQFIAVGTPPDEDGSADLQYVLAAARNIGRYMTGAKVVVDKSTVPVGTALHVRDAIATELARRGVRHEFSVVSNPEFLKEGAAVDDFMRPDRIVIGTDSDEAGERAREQMKRLYAPFNRNHERTRYMDVRSAEFTKYAANAMLATRISFMNELANLADRVGADIEAVRRGIGSDPRIGYDFLYAGVGYGGSCFPKDVRAGADRCRIRPVAADSGSRRSGQRCAEEGAAREDFGAVRGRSVGAHVRAVGAGVQAQYRRHARSASRDLIAGLLKRGASVRAYDPVATEEARRVLALDLGDDPGAHARLQFVATSEEAAAGADALVIVTEWKVFKSPNFAALVELLNEPVIFDGRNLYEPEAMGGG
jgi:UDPglucose 6-dehydrogenase